MIRKKATNAPTTTRDITIPATAAPPTLELLPPLPPSLVSLPLDGLLLLLLWLGVLEGDGREGGLYDGGVVAAGARLLLKELPLVLQQKA